MRSTAVTFLFGVVVHAPVIGSLIALLLMSSVWSADAQPVVSRQHSSSIVELTAAVSGFPGTRVLGPGLCLTAGNGGRVSVEGRLDWTDALNTEHFADQITWFFFWQVKHTLRTDGTSSRVFATYGTAGWIERQSVPPGRLRSSIVPPILPIVGAGWQRAVGKYLAIRLDGQFLIGPFEGMIAVPRVSGGVTIPLRRGKTVTQLILRASR
jgi:hypothetical protein